MIWIWEAENQNCGINDEFLGQSHTDKGLIDKNLFFDCMILCICQFVNSININVLLFTENCIFIMNCATACQSIVRLSNALITLILL
jgi:hypothetical protein